MKKKYVLFTIVLILMMLLGFLFLRIETKAFNPPPGSMILSTSYVDVGLQEQQISFNLDDGSYGLNGIPLYGLHSYVTNVLEGGVEYITWAVVQDDLKPFELYILGQKIELDSYIYFVRLNYASSMSQSYLTFHAHDFSILKTNTFDLVNSTWQLKREIPNDNILEQLQSSFDKGKKEGYDKGMQDTIESYRYYDSQTQQYYTTTEWGLYNYELGLSESDFSWWSMLLYGFTLPWQVLSIELLPGLYIGYFALIPLVLGVIGILFKFRGKRQ